MAVFPLKVRLPDDYLLQVDKYTYEYLPNSYGWLLYFPTSPRTLHSSRTYLYVSDAVIDAIETLYDDNLPF